VAHLFGAFVAFGLAMAMLAAGSAGRARRRLGGRCGGAADGMHAGGPCCCARQASQAGRAGAPGLTGPERPGRWLAASASGAGSRPEAGG